jgi:predicted nucleic acid-binding protein
MSDRVFLDTNIFVYTFDLNAPAKAAMAASLIRSALQSQNGFISYQVVQEFFNVALRRFAQPMSAADAVQYLGTVLRPMLRIHSSQALFAEALNVKASAGLSWFDSIIVASALQAGCTRLLTEDLQHGRRIGSLCIENPFL